MIRAVVIGALGYTGEELVKILLKHPLVELIGIFDKMEGKRVKLSKIYNLKIDLYCTDIDMDVVKDCDVAFLALPHGTSLKFVPKLLEMGKRVIDLSADFRLKNKRDYFIYYDFEHPHPELLNEAVYGLSEIHRDEIKDAKLVANPGCYPTGVILGCKPFLKYMADVPVIIDAKSGYSGGGRKFANEYLKSKDVYAYQIGVSHRHIAEIIEEVKRDAIFSPHVIPLERGIISTIYLKLKNGLKTEDAVKILSEFYTGACFIKVLKNELPRLNDVIYTNNCLISVKFCENSNYLIIVTCLDNLMKGASGQAVQNMNIMFGFDEREGLT